MENILWSSGHPLILKNIVGADKCRIFDADGNSWLDLESGIWCTNLGHNHPAITRTINKQVSMITHSGFCYCNPVIGQASDAVLEMSNLHGGKCEFLCSGSEAVEYGMRIARAISPNPLAITFSDGYFGAYGEAARKPADSWYVYNHLECSCVGNEGCLGECAGFEKIPFHNIGIFLFEPGSSSGLVRFPSKALIEKIVSRIRRNNGIVIANEITTGAGRTGKWAGHQHYDFTADIIAMGKGIGNGYPVSVTAVSARVAAQVGEKPFLYAQSHQNDPLGAAVVKTVIDEIKHGNLVQRAEKLGTYILQRLEDMRFEFPLIKQVRGRGLMIAIEFSGKAFNIFNALLQKGIILCHRPNTGVLRLDPPLTIEKQDADIFLETLGEVLNQKQ